MLNSFNNEKCTIDTFGDPENSFCAGIAQHEFAIYKEQPYSSKDAKIFIDGEFYPLQKRKDLSSAFNRSVGMDQYSGLNEISGVFSAVGFDFKKKKIKLVSDKFGLKPVYYSKTSNGFVFASEVKAISKTNPASKELNKSTFSDFFHFGFALGHKILLKNIHLLQPGAVVTFDI